MSTEDGVELEPFVVEVEREEVNISFADLLRALAQVTAAGAAPPATVAGLAAVDNERLMRVGGLASQLHEELAQLDPETVERLVQQLLDPRSAEEAGTSPESGERSTPS